MRAILIAAKIIKTIQKGQPPAEHMKFIRKTFGFAN